MYTWSVDRPIGMEKNGLRSRLREVYGKITCRPYVWLVHWYRTPEPAILSRKPLVFLPRQKSDGYDTYTVLFAAKHVLGQRGLESHLTAVSNIESLQQRTL